MLATCAPEQSFAIQVPVAVHGRGRVEDIVAGAGGCDRAKATLVAPFHHLIPPDAEW